MYVEHFGLKSKPFEQLPDPAFMFLSEKHDTALTSIEFAFGIQDSFVVVTGEIGSGKTTLLHKFMAENLADAAVAYVTQTRLSDIELLQSILVEFGEAPFGKGKVELITMLKRFINSQHRDGRRVVIVIDEAQNLTADVLEELRLVTCVSPGTTRLVNVVLVGQPQFNRLIDSPALVQLRQRCRLRYHLKALTEEETKRYIEHRLAVAGGSLSSIFDSGLIRTIFYYCRGIPRLINMLCDTAMIFAFVDKSPHVSADDIRQALDDLGWEEPGGQLRSGPTMAHSQLLAAQENLADLKDANSGTVYPITDTTCVIGRAVNCTLRIKHPALSRYHAMIKQVGDEWILSDIKSLNGVYLNGRRVSQAKLRNNDRIGIGEHQLIFLVKGADRIGNDKTKPPAEILRNRPVQDEPAVGEEAEDTFRS